MSPYKVLPMSPVSTGNQGGARRTTDRIREAPRRASWSTHTLPLPIRRRSEDRPLVEHQPPTRRILSPDRAAQGLLLRIGRGFARPQPIRRQDDVLRESDDLKTVNSVTKGSPARELFKDSLLVV